MSRQHVYILMPIACMTSAMVYQRRTLGNNFRFLTAVGLYYNWFNPLLKCYERFEVY